MSELSKYRRDLDQWQGRSDILTELIDQSEMNWRVEKRTGREIEQAKEIVHRVTKEVQESVSLEISKLVTSTLAAVLEKEDRYTFRFQLILKKRGFDVEMWFEKDDNVYEITEVGGGIWDLASIALRVGLWTLLPAGIRTRGVIVLDEPFRFLSMKFQPYAGEMMRFMADELSLQIIVISHKPEIIDSANRIFHLTKPDGKVSKVTVEDNL